MDETKWIGSWLKVNITIQYIATILSGALTYFGLIQPVSEGVTNLLQFYIWTGVVMWIIVLTQYEKIKLEYQKKKPMSKLLQVLGYLVSFATLGALVYNDWLITAVFYTMCMALSYDLVYNKAEGLE